MDYFEEVLLACLCCFVFPTNKVFPGTFLAITWISFLKCLAIDRTASNVNNQSEVFYALSRNFPRGYEENNEGINHNGCPYASDLYMESPEKGSRHANHWIAGFKNIIFRLDVWGSMK